MPGACDDNSACALLGLEGTCCAEQESSFLDCCSDHTNKVSKKIKIAFFLKLFIKYFIKNRSGHPIPYRLVAVKTPLATGISSLEIVALLIMGFICHAVHLSCRHFDRKSLRKAIYVIL